MSWFCEPPFRCHRFMPKNKLLHKPLTSYPFKKNASSKKHTKCKILSFIKDKNVIFAVNFIYKRYESNRKTKLS